MNIAFPVYLVGAHKPTVTNGIMYYVQANEEDSVYRAVLVDDKNLTGTFAMRRLQIKEKKYPLFKLRYAIFFIADLIKLAKKGTWFIDSEGNLFQYEKTLRVPLVYKKISQLIPIKTGGCIVEVEGLSERFKTLHMPTNNPTWAGILQVRKSAILYGLYDKQYKNTTRLI